MIKSIKHQCNWRVQPPSQIFKEKANAINALCAINKYYLIKNKSITQANNITASDIAFLQNLNAFCNKSKIYIPGKNFTENKSAKVVDKFGKYIIPETVKIKLPEKFKP